MYLIFIPASTNLPVLFNVMWGEEVRRAAIALRNFAHLK